MTLAQKVVLSSAMASGMVVGAAHDAGAITPEQRFDRVKYQTLQGPDWTRLENRRTITAAFAAFGMGNRTAMCVASRESGMNEDARNRYSSAAGLFQHLGRYWAGRVDAYNHRVGKRLGVKPNASIYSARANALVSAQMVRAGGWGPWTTSGAC